MQCNAVTRTGLLIVSITCGVLRPHSSHAQAVDSARVIETRADSAARFLSAETADSVLAWYHRAARLYSDAGRGADEGRAVNSIGRMHLMLANADTAYTYFHRALRIRRDAGDRSGEAGTLNNLGSATGDLGQLDSAYVYYSEALAIHRETGNRAEEGRVLANIGRAHDDLGRLDSAMVAYRSALSVLREVGDRSAEANVLNGIGNTNSHGGRPDSALTYFGLALRIHREMEDRTQEAQTINNMGVIYKDTGQPDSAFSYFHQALAIHRETGNRGDVAGTLNNIGNVHGDIGRQDSAGVYYHLALLAHRQTGDRVGQAMVLTNLGIVKLMLGLPDSALTYLKNALALHRESQYRRGQTATLGVIGIVLDNVGRSDSALAYYHEALAMQRESGDLAGAGMTLTNIGAAHYSLARIDSALIYFHQGLVIQRQTGDRVNEAQILSNLGVMHSNLGRPDSALAYYGRALSVFRETRARTEEGSLLGTMGIELRKLGQRDSAVTYLTHALAINRETGNRVEVGRMLTVLGSTHLDANRPDSALAYHREALAVHQETGKRDLEALTLSHIGRVHGLGSRPDSALPYYRAALAIQREIGDRAFEARSLTDIGLILLHAGAGGQGDPAGGAAYFDTAAAVYAGIRGDVGDDANVIGLTDQKDHRTTYTSWAQAWLARSAELGEDAAARGAIAAAERGRAQALLKLLDRTVSESADVAGVIAASVQPGADLPAEADILLASLRATRNAALSYLLIGDTLVTWLVTPSGDVRVHRNQIALDTLASIIASVRSGMGADEARGSMVRGQGRVIDQETTEGIGIGKRGFEDSLNRLAKLLFPAELAQLLPVSAEVVIVPHGILGLVPFAALPWGQNGDPLAVRHAVRYTPSFAMLASLAEDSVRSSPGSRGSGGAVVVGDPAMPWVPLESGDSIQLRGLPAARTEGLRVAEVLGVTLLTGVLASESAVREQLPFASIVHMATHGLAFGSDARARDSYVALAPDARHDGLLTMGELLDDDDLVMSADLVVLSACQTGLGDVRDAEGTVGLQRAFLAKGARSVLVSLWSVDDEATRLLMQRFYAHWRAGAEISKAEALRRAQNDVRGTAGFEHPRYWAAFQLVGAR